MKTTTKQLEKMREQLFEEHMNMTNWPAGAKKTIREFEKQVGALNGFVLAKAENPHEAPFYKSMYACDDTELLWEFAQCMFNNEARFKALEPVFDRQFLDVISFYINVIGAAQRIAGAAPAAAPSGASGTLIFAHDVNHSVFRESCSVEKPYQDALFKALGQTVNPGQHADIMIEIDGLQFPCRVSSPVQNNRPGLHLVFLKWTKNKIGLYLQQKYPELYSFFTDAKEANGGKMPRNIAVPSGLEQSFRFVYVAPGQFRMEF